MRPHLRLSMIVKNEAANLPRCLSAAAPFLGSYVIADTGSTDGTPELARRIMARHGVPGVVVEGVPFEDFSQARNAALELAESWEGSEPYDLLVLCDADMELVVPSPDSLLESLSDAPCFSVMQTQVGVGGMTYPNVRLVRRGSRYRYVKPTHEYLDAPEEASVPFETLHFLDHDDGGSKSDKYARDERLLRSALEKDPSDARSMFYLAQTLRCLGKHDEAIAWYERRILAGGFAEECWYAQTRIAECRLATNDSRGVADALHAYQSSPHRSEPLHQLAHYYRLRGENPCAAMFARAGLAIPYPAEAKLFVDHGVYRYGLREELSIAGFYSTDPSVRSDARRACLELSVARDVPCGVRYDAGRNSVHYALSASEVLGAGSARELAPALARKDGEAWAPMNPSVAWAPDGRLVANLRLVNYELGTWASRTGDGLVRTRNVSLVLDPSTLEVLESREMFDMTREPARFPHAPVRGLEDVRIFAWRGRLWGSCTVLDRNAEGGAEIALVELDELGDVAALHIQREHEPHLHQKNWVPLVRGEELFFIYKAEPFQLLRVNPSDLRARPYSSRSHSTLCLDGLRGGSQAIPWGAGYLYLAHESHDFGQPGEFRRTYLHRFIVLDADLLPACVTEPFFLEHRGVEFAAGMARVGDDLVITYGSEDAHARVFVVPVSAVERLAPPC